MPVIKEVCVMHVNRNIVLFIFLGLTGFVIWILIKVLIGVLGRSCECGDVFQSRYLTFISQLLNSLISKSLFANFLTFQ
jgi:hypothetical protein